MNSYGIDFTTVNTESVIVNEELVSRNLLYSNCYSEILLNNYTRNNHDDYTMSLFSTFHSDLSVTYPNNIFLPITIDKKIKGLYENLKGIKRIPDDGVYIIETYTFKNKGLLGIKELKNRYIQLLHRNVDDCKLWEDTVESITTSESNSMLPIKVKIVTFISKTELDKNPFAYVPNANITITPSGEFANCMHPTSRSSKYGDLMKELLSHSSDNLISLDIINNISPYKPYYISIGNSIIKILSKPSEVMSNKATIAIKQNNSIQDIKEITDISDLKEFGIYNTEEEALHNSSIENIIQAKKIEQEFKNISLNELKIKSELEALKLKHEGMVFNNKMEIYKRLLEVASLETKFKTEILKHDHEVFKMKFNMSKGVYDTNKTFLKDTVTIVGKTAVGII